jgi:hypothetical protein
MTDSFRAEVQELIAHIPTTQDATAVLHAKFPRLKGVGVEKRGPGYFFVTIRDQGDPEAPLVEIQCGRNH